MAIARKRAKMKRTQISLLPEEYEAAKRIAAERGVSFSQIVRDGIRCIREGTEQEERDYFEKMWSIVGIVKDADPHGSENVDEMIYGPDFHR